MGAKVNPFTGKIDLTGSDAVLPFSGGVPSELVYWATPTQLGTATSTIWDGVNLSIPGGFTLATTNIITAPNFYDKDILFVNAGVIQGSSGSLSYDSIALLLTTSSLTVSAIATLSQITGFNNASDNDILFRNSDTFGTIQGSYGSFQYDYSLSRFTNLGTSFFNSNIGIGNTFDDPNLLLGTYPEITFRGGVLQGFDANPVTIQTFNINFSTGDVTLLKGVNYSWPTVNAPGPLINDGGGLLIWGGVINVANGGTNISSYNQGDMLYASGTFTISTLAKSALATRYISNTGTDNNPAWAQVNVSNGVTGMLNIANGGTGTSTAPSIGQVVYASSTEKYGYTGPGSTGQILQSTGAAAPVYSTATYPSTAGTSGNVLTSNGTNLVSSALVAYQTVQDEGTNLTQRTKLNFKGTGVTATDNAGTGATDVTIPSVTIGGSTTQVQFNDDDFLGGDTNFLWDKTNNILKIPNLQSIDVSTDLVISTPNQTVNNTDGKNVDIRTGNGLGAANGGLLRFFPGTSGSTSGYGGDVSFLGGLGVTGGGGANIQGGSCIGTGKGGRLTLLSGSSSGTNQAGEDFVINTGRSTGNQPGGNLNINISVTGSSGSGANSDVEIASFKLSTIVFNETGSDCDFRVEGDTDANLIMVDASSDSVGIGQATPSAFFHIKAGTSSKAPFKLASGTNLTTPEAGAIEWDGTNLAFTV